MATFRKSCPYLLASLALAVISPFTSQAHAERLRIAVIAGLTGSWGMYGRAYQDGIQLEQQQSGDKNLLDVVYEDDQFTPRISVTVFRKLLMQGHLDAIIVGDTPTAIALAPEVEQKKIPMFAWASEHPSFLGKKYVIRTWPKFSDEAKLVATEVKNTGVRKVALWAGPHEHAVGFVDAVEQELKPLAVKKQEFSEDLTDYRSPLLQLKAQNISLLGLCLNSGQNSLAINQAKQLGLDIAFFGCTFLNNTDDIKALHDTKSEAWIYDTNVQKNFAEAFEHKTGSAQLVNSGALMFDVALVLQKIAEGSPDTDILDRLANVGMVHGANQAFSIKQVLEDRYFDFSLAKNILK